MCTITVECLADDEEPADYVGRNGQTLRVDGAEAELLNELRPGSG